MDYNYEVAKPKSGKAIASMVCGILALCGGGVVLGIVACILSSGIDADTYRNAGMAKAGKICGIIAIILGVLAVLAVIAYYVIIIVILGGAAVLGGAYSDSYYLINIYNCIAPFLM